MNPRLQQKIKTHIKVNSDTGCWLWTGQISNSGYGKLMIKDENNRTSTQGAQEISYTAFIGPIPGGMLTRHNCGNRLCVNPEHLELFKT